MKISIESMVDTQRLILMSHGEVFIWHIQQHILNKGHNQTSMREIPEGEVGCKICGKSLKEIFKDDQSKYLEYMRRNYKE